MAGFEPALSGIPSRRIARLSYILSEQGSSGGWGRTSGLRGFSAALVPAELHRNRSETPAGVEPALMSGCSRPPGRPAPASWENKSRRWDSNPLRPRYEGGARPVEHRRPTAKASAGVEPARPRFRASIPCRGSGQKTIQSQRRDSNPHAPLYRRGARPIERHWRSEQGWVAGYDPAPRRSQGRMQRHYTIPTIGPLPASIPVRSRTSPSTFARSRATGTLRGQACAMDQYPGQESNLDLLLRTEP